MKKIEQKFTTEFRKWLMVNLKQTGAYEIKIAHGKSLPFASVKEHQIQALYHAKHGTISFKIPDCGFQNPFDLFQLVQVPAYIVVRFESKNFYFLDIDDFINLKNTSVRKSLTEED